MPARLRDTYKPQCFIDILRTIAFMGLEAKLPIKSRSVLPFFVQPCIPFILSFLFRHSHDLSTLESRRWIASLGRETWHVEAISACFDKQFVCREEQIRAGEIRRKAPFTFSCRTRFFSIPFVVRRDLTRPRNKSALRRECAHSALVPSHRVHFVSLSPFYPMTHRSNQGIVARITCVRELIFFSAVLPKCITVSFIFLKKKKKLIKLE